MRHRHAPLLALAALTALASCGDDSAPAAEELGFPEGFLFGTAIAGFQVEMGCPTIEAAVCEDRASDWYEFITAPETLGSSSAHLAGDPPSAGPGHYELFEQDFDNARDALGTGALRFSLEWSRIFPEPTDDAEGYEALRELADPVALAHYHAVLDALSARGLSPLVTLNHYTLPTWIHDAVGCHVDLDACSPRGWVDRERTVREIAKYAGFAAREFGGKVDRWATLNEPFAVVLPGYLMPSADRSNPPAVSLRFDEAKTVLLGLIEAHARMYDAVKANDLEDADGDGVTSEVGVVYAMAPVAPSDPSNELDVTAAANVFYLFNLVYLNAVVKGDLDVDLDGIAEHRPDLADRMDYVGINYYTRATVQGTPEPTLPALSKLSTFNPFTLVAWEDYPRGLYEMAMVVKEMGKPAIVTENGSFDPDKSSEFFVPHMTWLSRAIADGADVRGYFYWTLIDNYEWNHGMGIRMGLFAVDPADPSKTRTPRPGAGVYAEITAARAITPALTERYPAPR